jgi:hypothetical protein
MRHLAIILALLTAACAPAAMDGTRTYGSQQATDAALAAFGRDNSSCRMWTNWQSLCSLLRRVELPSVMPSWA